MWFLTLRAEIWRSVTLIFFGDKEQSRGVFQRIQTLKKISLKLSFENGWSWKVFMSLGSDSRRLDYRLVPFGVVFICSTRINDFSLVHKTRRQVTWYCYEVEVYIHIIVVKAVAFIGAIILLAMVGVLAFISHRLIQGIKTVRNTKLDS